MLRQLIAVAVFALVAGTAHAGCANYVAEGIEPPRANLCFEGKCEETRLIAECGGGSGFLAEYENGWAFSSEDPPRSPSGAMTSKRCSTCRSSPARRSVTQGPARQPSALSCTGSQRTGRCWYPTYQPASGAWSNLRGSGSRRFPVPPYEKRRPEGQGLPDVLKRGSNGVH